MLARIAIATLAGFVSVVTPCVLPLVPGYLSAVSAVEVGRLGQSGLARRVVLASVPFLLGFTFVFVLLGAGASALGGLLGPIQKEAVAGFVLVVLGLTFLGLLPWPERVLAPGLLTGARRSGSGFLLGGAFALCALACIGPILATILVLAGDTGTVLEGSVLLAAYSAGLALAFVLVAVAYVRAMGAMRWLRDHYGYVRAAGGVTLVALGLLVFFGRLWWLQVYMNRALEAVGLGELGL